MSKETTILEGYSNIEKGAYLGALASLATADRNASTEELDYLKALIETAGISEDHSELIMHAATTEVADEDLEKFLQILKTSELRFSLLSDVIAFANADNDYSEAEQHKVNQIAKYLGVNEEQVNVLSDFTTKATLEIAEQAESVKPDGNDSASFLGGLGFSDKLKNAGINTNSLFRGALGIIGPMLLGRMLGGGRRKTGGGGLLGGLLGGGRGFGSAAGMLGRLFKK